MQIEEKKVVALEYTLKNDSGAVIESSQGKRPLLYLHGSGNVLPGLERALAGKTVGDALEVTLPAEDAYGPRNDGLVRNVPLRKLPTRDPKPGMALRVQTDQGPAVVVVKAVRGDYATLDMNHPLAGMTLCFSVKVLEVRDATEEELTHGHAHGPEGHGH